MYVWSCFWWTMITGRCLSGTPFGTKTQSSIQRCEALKDLTDLLDAKLYGRIRITWSRQPELWCTFICKTFNLVTVNMTVIIILSRIYTYNCYQMSFYIMISSMMHIEQQIIKSLFLIVIDIQRKTRTYNTLGKNFYCMCDHANHFWVP